MEVTTVILHDRSSMQRDPALFTELARHAMLNCLLLKSYDMDPKTSSVCICGLSASLCRSTKWRHMLWMV